MVNRSGNSTRLFLCVLLVIVVISGSLCSSLRTATAANSTFGFYFGSPIKNATSTLPTNATAKPTTKATVKPPTNATANRSIIPSLNQSFRNETSIVSTYIPLTGQLSKGNYINLMDLKAFKVVKGDLAMRVPCDYKGDPKVTIIAGVLPNFKTVKTGNGITNATLDGKPILHLSVNGVSCLYNAVIPAEITNIALINTSGEDLKFDQVSGEYAVTITAQLR